LNALLIEAQRFQRRRNIFGARRELLLRDSHRSGETFRISDRFASLQKLPDELTIDELAFRCFANGRRDVSPNSADCKMGVEIARRQLMSVDDRYWSVVGGISRDEGEDNA
jgi:hypothetical protein